MHLLLSSGALAIAMVFLSHKKPQNVHTYKHTYYNHWKQCRATNTHFLFPNLPLNTVTWIFHPVDVFSSFCPIVWQQLSKHCRQLGSACLYAPIDKYPCCCMTEEICYPYLYLYMYECTSQIVITVPGVDAMITIVSNFCQFLAKNWRF
jgi:hypothetical protein